MSSSLNTTAALSLQRTHRPRSNRAFAWRLSEADLEDGQVQLSAGDRVAIGVHREAHHGAFPEVRMCLCHDGATLASVSRWARTELGLDVPVSRLLKLNRRYGAKPTAKLRPTLLSLQSVVDACSGQPSEPSEPQPPEPSEPSEPSELESQPPEPSELEPPEPSKLEPPEPPQPPQPKRRSAACPKCSARLYTSAATGAMTHGSEFLDRVCRDAAM